MRRAIEYDVSGVAGAGYLNNMAYQFKSAGKLEQGLKLLFITRDMYPEEANLYDSIGEFYLEKGDRETSIQWYEKALEIDPDFENAQRMLKKIRESM